MKYDDYEEFIRPERAEIAKKEDNILVRALIRIGLRKRAAAHVVYAVLIFFGMFVLTYIIRLIF